MELVKRLKLFWDSTTGEDRKMLAHSLFDEISYDLDAKRIVDFKVKIWAEPFLMLRAELLKQDLDDETKNRLGGGSSSEVSYFSPTPTQSERKTPPNAALGSDYVQFLELIRFPQRSALERLLTN